jgi:transcriptional regulator with XRE-family HTH domain
LYQQLVDKISKWKYPCRMPSPKRNRLKVLRAERDLSQMELAFKVGMGRDRYMRIERGFINATAAERRDLARALRVQEPALGLSPDIEAQAS